MTSNKFLLSIIIPVLRPNADFVRCISAINAAFSDLSSVQIIVVTSSLYITELNDRYPYIEFFSESGSGIYSAMNDGANLSSGSYLFFMGIDDIILPLFSAAIPILRTHQPLALFADVYWGSRSVYSGNPSSFGILVRNLCH